jgi:hypothetical protein
MVASVNTVDQVLEVLEKHVDPATMVKILDELLDVPGNKSFRDTITLMQSRAIARASDQRRG